MQETRHTKLNRTGYPVTVADRLLSVVIAVADEEGNILPLAGELTRALAAIPEVSQSHEIIFVDDQSRDKSRDEIMEAMRQFPNIRLICHQSRHGKSQGINTALRNARGQWVVTMDGDGQNDPADIEKLLELAWANGRDGNRLVAGVRANRQTTQAKRWASRFANNVRRALLQDDCVDTGCAVKVFRRDAHLALPYFDNIHRYLPALFRLYGLDIVYTPVNDRPRRHGVSKYTNWRRGIDGLFDLIGVMWLQRRHHGIGEESVEVIVPQAATEAPRLRAAAE